MTEKVIHRAENKIESEDFYKMTQLNVDYPWLIDNSTAFFDLWCLAENTEQKELIEHLIKNFTFIDSKQLTSACRSISNQIENIWKLSFSNTFFLATCDDSKPDGSQSLVQSLKNKFSINWKEKNFFNSLPVGAHNINSNSNVVLVDDFIGTGNTIKRKLEYLNSIIAKRELKNIKIRIITIAAMGFSKVLLDKLEVEYFSAYWLNKGISELINGANKTSAIESMEYLESKLKDKYKNRTLPNFGYERSEALFAFADNNIPNNVFPIFWWPYYSDNNLRNTLFKRI